MRLASPGAALRRRVCVHGNHRSKRPRHEAGRTDPLRVEALLANRTLPPVRARAFLVDLDGLAVLVIEVEDSERTVGTAAGAYLRRTLRGTGDLPVSRSTRTRCLRTRSSASDAPCGRRPRRATRPSHRPEPRSDVTPPATDGGRR